MRFGPSKIIKRQGFIIMTPQDDEDIYHLYNILLLDDVITMKS
jgi:stalled ribosome rescue protein Dom34